MTREELEKDLVVRDKQSLISDALKIYDTNLMLVDTNRQQALRISDQEEQIEALEAKLTLLESHKRNSVKGLARILSRMRLKKYYK